MTIYCAPGKVVCFTQHTSVLPTYTLGYSPSELFALFLTSVLLLSLLEISP